MNTLPPAIEAGYNNACREIYETKGCVQCAAVSLMASTRAAEKHELGPEYVTGIMMACNFVLESKHTCAVPISDSDMVAFLMGKKITTPGMVVNPANIPGVSEGEGQV